VAVTLKVTETEPGIKGATAAAQTKAATLETGLVVQVQYSLGDERSQIGRRVRHLADRFPLPY